ncbi:hypothetical protein CEXT_435491 [Caerostris extrusa]|uniref:Uncharacterized protein n=1 Tax=Caerostris extrusa TaxID=172846 RepID=A0AAV4R299_CAEEX|nr:hypothetical protein CEXT_435491 [Caerostris extrusa]
MRRFKLGKHLLPLRRYKVMELIHFPFAVWISIYVKSLPATSGECSRRTPSNIGHPAITLIFPPSLSYNLYSVDFFLLPLLDLSLSFFNEWVLGYSAGLSNPIVKVALQI